MTGVPSTGCHMFSGTLSGWAGKVASVTSIEMRSSTVSPMPTMPPEQTRMPPARTWASVVSRSSMVRVVMISG